MNPATVWARTLVDELVRGGLREVCVAPGSRSTPLVLAFARRPEITLRLHLDERSAAFYALGWGKASGHPAAVVTTSGTAVANLVPAVVEADASGTPLLLLTADRPPRLRGQDANQTIDQIRIFGSFARASLDVRPPSAEECELRALRRLVDRALADAVGAPAGPVHLNLPFDKPLEPEGEEDTDVEEADSVDGRVRATAGPAPGATLRITRRRAGAGRHEIGLLADAVQASGRPVLVAGPVPDPARVGPAVRRFASACGLPLLADPLSGARWTTDAAGDAGGARPEVGRAADGVVGGYDLFLDVDAVRRGLRPDLVVRVGRAPTSAAVGRWLEEHRDVRQIVVDPGDRWKDHGGTATDHLRADVPPALDGALAAIGDPAGAARSTTEWRRRWSAYAGATLDAVASSAAFRGGHEGRIVRAVASMVPRGSPLFVSSSMPVRDLDAFAFPDDRDDPLVAFGNRGASGIDGIVSSALGVAGATRSKAVAVVGDVAFCHDMNGLLATRLEGVEAVFVVLHNDGGAIFHLLPVRDHEPAFTPFFATPHGLDLRHAAALYGLPYEEVDVRGDGGGGIGPALRRALDAPGSHLLVVRTDRDENERRHRDLRREIRDSLTSITDIPGSD